MLKNSFALDLCDIYHSINLFTASPPELIIDTTKIFQTNKHKAIIIGVIKSSL